MSEETAGEASAALRSRYATVSIGKGKDGEEKVQVALTSTWRERGLGKGWWGDYPYTPPQSPLPLFPCGEVAKAG